MIKNFDDRRDIVIPGDESKTILFSIQHFIDIANSSIKDHDYFAVALSGGSTPKRIFEGLASAEYRDKIDWSKVLIFWGDERSVPPNDPESNFQMADKAFLSKVSIPSKNIFRMEAENNIEDHALSYENLIKAKIPSGKFDLVMLGMGADGHTASLFPKTEGLHAKNRLVIANHVPQKQTWRMSLTYECINSAKNVAIYVLGASKSSIVKQVLKGAYSPDDLPIQRIGSPAHHALWILDSAAASELK